MISRRRRRRCSSPSSPIATFLFHWSLLWSSPPFFHRRTSLALSTLSMPSMQTAPAMLMMEVRATSASAMSDGTWPFLQPVLILNLSHLFNSISMNDLPKPNHKLKTRFLHFISLVDRIFPSESMTISRKSSLELDRNILFFFPFCVFADGVLCEGSRWLLSSSCN